MQVKVRELGECGIHTYRTPELCGFLLDMSQRISNSGTVRSGFQASNPGPQLRDLIGKGFKRYSDLGNVHIVADVTSLFRNRGNDAARLEPPNSFLHGRRRCRERIGQLSDRGQLATWQQPPGHDIGLNRVPDSSVSGGVVSHPPTLTNFSICVRSLDTDGRSCLASCAGTDGTVTREEHIMHMERSAGTLPRQIELSQPEVDPQPCFSCGSSAACVAPVGEGLTCREVLEFRAWGACPCCCGRRVVPGTTATCGECEGLGFVELVVDHFSATGQEMVVYAIPSHEVESEPAVTETAPVPGSGRCLHCDSVAPCVVPHEADYAADDDLYECWESLELRAWGACPVCRGRGNAPAGGACSACQGGGLRELAVDLSCWDDAIKVDPNRPLDRA